MIEFRMPSLGADMEAGTLVEWMGFVNFYWLTTAAALRRVIDRVVRVMVWCASKTYRTFAAKRLIPLSVRLHGGTAAFRAVRCGLGAAGATAAEPADVSGWRYRGRPTPREP